MGLERDDYPKRFMNTSFSVRPISPWRTMVQTINLLYVKDTAGLTGSEAHTQVPTQFIVPPSLNGEIAFEVILVDPNKEFLDNIYKALLCPIYPLYLGTAYCLGRITGIEWWEGQRLDMSEGEVYGAIRASKLEGEIDLSNGRRVLRDRFPLKLSPNRDLLIADDLLIETQGLPIRAKVHDVFETNHRIYALL